MSLAFSVVFLIVRLGLQAFGKEITELKCPCHHSHWGTCHLHDAIVDVNFHHLVKIVFARTLSTVKLLFLFLYSYEMSYQV